MQTLQVRPLSKERADSQKTQMLNEINITPVDTRVKQRVLEWLGSEVKLLKTNQRLIEDLPLYCKNGVFLCDLANRLSGRHGSLKGIDRNPKNVTQILNNFNRVLDFFRSYPRFCPRYLWAHRHLMDGDPDVLWGLLDDVWHWAHNKISPNDPCHSHYLIRETISPPRLGTITSLDKPKQVAASKPPQPQRAPLSRGGESRNSTNDLNIKRVNQNSFRTNENAS